MLAHATQVGNVGSGYLKLLPHPQGGGRYLRVRLEEVLHRDAALVRDGEGHIPVLDRVRGAALTGGGGSPVGAAAIASVAYRREGARLQDDRLRRLRPGSGRGHGARVGEAAGRQLAAVAAAAGGEHREGYSQGDQGQRKGACGHGGGG